MAAQPEPLRDTVVRAVHVLYVPGTSQDDRRQADEWLKNFQKSTEAWSCADELLRTDGVATEVQYFAANTMRNKLRYDFQEVPAEARESLKVSLLGILARHKDSPSNIQTQICLGVAELALQMEEWRDSVKDLVTNFGSSMELLPALLQVLSVLAENAEDSIGDPAERVRLDQKMIQASVCVMQYLHHWFPQTSGHSRHRNSVLKCFARWIRFIDAKPEEIVASPIVVCSLGEALSDGELFESACEVACELARRSENAQHHMPIVLVLTGKVPELKALYEKALQEEDVDTCRGLTRVLTEIAERYRRLLVEGTPDALRMVEILLLCTSHPDETVAPLTFNFWDQLSRELQQNEAQKQLFMPIFGQLVDILSCKAMYPTEADDWSHDQEEDWRNFRHNVADALLDACSVVGGAQCIARVVPAFQASVAACQAGTGGWREVETRLYCIRSVGRLVPKGDESTGHILALLPNLPEHWRVRYTASLLIGRYSHWVAEHPQFLAPLFAYAVAGLGQSEVCSAAAMALHYLCHNCAPQMGAVMDQLLVVYDNLAVLPLHDQTEVIKGVGAVLSKLPEPSRAPALERLVQPAAAALEQALEARAAGQPVVNANVSSALSRITALLHAVAGEEGLGADARVLIAPAISRLWPRLDGVFPAFGGESAIAEQLCRCVKQAVRCGGPELEPLLNPLLGRLVEGYSAHKHSAMLYVLNGCVGVFGDLERTQPALLQAVIAVSTTTFQLLQGGLEPFTNNPDIVEEFFELAGRCLRRFPQQILQSGGLVDTMTRCALVALTLQHVSACESVLVFLETLCTCDPPKGTNEATPQHKQAVLALFHAHGSAMMHGLVAALAGAVPAQLNSRVSDVLQAAFLLEREAAGSWVTAAVNALPPPPQGPALADRQVFMESLSRGGERRVVRQAANTFSHKSRRCRNRFS